MGDNIIKWIAAMSIRVGPWAFVVLTFIPIVTIIFSTMLITLDGSVMMDLFYLIQMFLPFNFNVIMLWSITIGVMFAIHWTATKYLELLDGLIVEDVRF